MLLALTGCDGSDSDNIPINLTSEPTLVAKPNPLVPLTAVMELSTDVATTVELVVTEVSQPVLAEKPNAAAAVPVAADGDETMILTFDEETTDHVLPILGLRSDRAYEVSVTLFAKAGSDRGRLDVEETFPIQTDPLPEQFPNMALEVSDPTRMEPGLTLLSLRQFRGPSNIYTIVDSQGEVVWYYDAPARIGDARQLDNGNLLFIMGGEVVEMDMLGNEVRRYYATAQGETVPGSIPVEGSTFHHEVFPTPFGTYLVLGREPATVENFPTSLTECDAPTETAEVVDDVLYEFDQDGVVLNRWAFVDFLDPTRVGYTSFDRNNDWAHANGVIYSEIDDSIVISPRAQDAVVKFSRETGEIIWILGTHENWTEEFQPYLLDPIGETFAWQYHQHAPQYTDSGSMVIYDNGNFKAVPCNGVEPVPDAENWSRAVEYVIDEENMTVEQIWDYGTETNPILYTRFIGDADWQAGTGNALITFGGISHENGVNNLNAGLAEVTARIIEVDRSGAGDKVFELYIWSVPDEVSRGWQVYRSERIPGLYR